MIQVVVYKINIYKNNKGVKYINKVLVNKYIFKITKPDINWFGVTQNFTVCEYLVICNNIWKQVCPNLVKNL